MTQYPQPPTLSYASAQIHPYQPARGRARAIIILSWILIALHLLLIWPSIADIRDIQAVIRGEELSEELSPVALAGVVLWLAFLVVYLITVVLWVMWVHRTYRNLPALGAVGLDYSSGWAVGYYFIPILNLFRPFQVMRQTWKASDPSYTQGTDWRMLSTPALLGWWWALHLLCAFANNASFRIGLRAEDPDLLLGLAWMDLFLLGFDSVLLLLEIKLVAGLTNLQEQRAAASGTLPVAQVAPVFPTR